MEPVMLRVYQGGNTGATAFFRNRWLLSTLMEELAALGRPEVSILVHAASIGAEPYSLALWHLNRPASKFELRIHATDINAQFLGMAQKGEYPVEVSRGLTDEERGWFVREGAVLRVPARARAMVEFLPAMDFVRQRPAGRFDAVLLMNALTYVTAPEQTCAVAGAAQSSDALLALTAFHPDSIRSDIEAVNFEPVMTNHQLIHESWGDRLTDKPIDPRSSAYSWKLPAYDANAVDAAWRFGALFRRRRA